MARASGVAAMRSVRSRAVSCIDWLPGSIRGWYRLIETAGPDEPVGQARSLAA
jgi:hypothetical protein